MENYKYTDVRFADIQILRYRLEGFGRLSLQQKKLIYCLSEATLWGRDITFDQFGFHNLKIRKVLEAIYSGVKGDSRLKSTSEGYGSQMEFIIIMDARSLNLVSQKNSSKRR